MPLGRVTQLVDCRQSMGMGKGGSLAQRGTISESVSYTHLTLPTNVHV